MSEQPNVRVARLRYAGEGQFVSESGSGHATVVDFSDAAKAASPMELILVALGGCMGADVVSILEKKRQSITAYEIEVRGERRDEFPRIYTSIEVRHRFRGHGVDPGAVAHAIELSEAKYCSVSAMLRHSTRINNEYEIAEDK